MTKSNQKFVLLLLGIVFLLGCFSCVYADLISVPEKDTRIASIEELFEVDTHLHIEGKAIEKTIEVNMGDGSGVKYYTAKTDYLYRLSIPTRDGYIFRGWDFDGKKVCNGWLMNSDGSVAEVGDYLDGKSLPKSITALWIMAGTKYTITIDSQKWGEVSPNGKVQVEAGENLEFTIKSDYLAEVMYDNKVLYQEEDGSYIIRNITKNGTVDVTYYDTENFDQVFELVSSYTPTNGAIANGIVILEFNYNNDGETPNGRYTSSYYRKYKVLPQTREGYTFIGWKDANDKIFKVGDTIDISPNKRIAGGPFIAQWKIKAVSNFRDVDTDDWFFDNVNYVVDKGLFKGVTDDEFAPNGSLTRGMLVTVLYRYAEAKTTKKSKFADVDENMYYSSPIAWASEKGIVNGVGDNKFDPEVSITRQDLVTILYRFAKTQKISISKKKDLSSFEDKNEVAEYAKDAIQWAIGSGVMNGRTKDTIAPTGTATRAETAAMMQRLSELKK